MTSSPCPLSSPEFVSRVAAWTVELSTTFFTGASFCLRGTTQALAVIGNCYVPVGTFSKVGSALQYEETSQQIIGKRV